MDTSTSLRASKAVTLMSNDLPKGGEQIIDEFLQSLREAGESPEFEEERVHNVKIFLQWCKAEGISLERGDVDE